MAVSFCEAVILAAFAGFTIYLGLPVGRLRIISPSWQARPTMGAARVILFPVVGESSGSHDRQTVGRMEEADAPCAG